MAKDKNKEVPENKIREGTEDYSINKDPKGTDRESYPKLKKQDQQYKDQPEFIDNDPNKKDEVSE
jgi:hypothetical protein